jgi:hypothetical protein
MAGIVVLFVGVLMTVMAVRSWRVDRHLARGDQPACASCHYDLSGVQARECPECGAALAAPGAVRRGTLTADALAVTGCVVLGGVGGLLMLMGALALAFGPGP